MAERSHVIYDNLYQKMKDCVQQSSNLNALKSIFSEIINKNQEALASTIPEKSIFVPAALEQKYYKILNTSAVEIRDIVKKSPDIDESHEVIKNPMYVSLCLLSIIFHHLKNEQMRKTTLFICSIYQYRSIRGGKYFKHVNQNTINCMNYTVSSLSYKSDLKKYKSISNVITKKTEFFIDCWFINDHQDELKSNVKILDITIHKMLNDLYGRYNSFLKDFSNKFYENYKNGKYMNVDKDIDDGDDYMESDNVSFMVEKSTNALMGKFSLSAYPNSIIIEHVCAIESGCSMNNLRNIMNYVYEHDRDFEKLIRLILQTYLFNYKKKITDIKSPDFILEMRTYYKKQTSQDDNLNQVKKIIDDFIIGSGITKKINRAATLNDCKKAVYLYMLFFIQRNI